MLKLSDNINAKLNKLVELDSCNNYKKELDDYFDINEEYKENSKIYDDFLCEYQKLNNGASYDSIIRVDYIIDLFNKYLFENNVPSLKTNMKIADYIMICNHFLDFLIRNYEIGFYRSTKKGNLKKLTQDIDVYYKLKVSNKEIDDDINSKYKEKIMTNILSLSFILTKENIRNITSIFHMIKNEKYWSKENQIMIPKFIVDKMIKLNMKKELFDFITEYPDLINEQIIDMVYDYNSATLVYNYLKCKQQYYLNITQKLDEYFNKIINILKQSNDIFFQKIYEKYSTIEINEIKTLENKIKIFCTIENELFNKIIDNESDILIVTSIFQNLSDEEKFEIQFNRLTKKFKKTSIINFDIHEITNSIIEEVQSISGFEKENNKSYFEKEKYNRKYISTDKKTENTLIILYYELSSCLQDLANNLIETKNLANKFNNIDNLQDLLITSLEKIENYELIDISNYSAKHIISDVYDTSKVKEILIEDMKKLNILEADIKVNTIDKYTKVRKTLYSATNFWNKFENNTNFKVDKDGQEYTPVVANYFKTVEILLNRKIKDIYLEKYNNGINLKKPYSNTGQLIDLLEQNSSLMLGEIIKYISRERQFIKDGLETEEFITKLKFWVDTVRNSNFHLDLILSKSKAKELKNKTLIMIADILDYLN